MKIQKMSKKFILLLIFGILYSNLINAQNEIRIGVNIGGTYSKFREKEKIEIANTRIDFLLGVSFEYNLQKNLSIKTNINYEPKSYSQKGYDFQTGLISNERRKINIFNYLSFPILIKYKFGNSRSFFIEGGPFIGHLLNSKYEYNDLPDLERTSLNQKTDFGLSIGIGKIFQLNDKSNINIQLRENLGLPNISKDQNIETRKTNSLNLILTWDLKL
jgi:hypothetical protein